MYSPVFLSWPTTSGSPPVRSISESDHSNSPPPPVGGLASSFACTLFHSRPLWRFMFFSKRAFNTLSNSSRLPRCNAKRLLRGCSPDNSFLLLSMLLILLYYIPLYNFFFFFGSLILASLYLSFK